jgi:hypothetical protein
MAFVQLAEAIQIQLALERGEFLVAEILQKNAIDECVEVVDVEALTVIAPTDDRWRLITQDLIQLAGECLRCASLASSGVSGSHSLELGTEEKGVFGG